MSFIDAINKERRHYYVPPLEFSPALQHQAQTWATELGRSNDFYHNPALDVDGFIQVGENLGMGETREQIWFWMRVSPAHHENIIYRHWTHAGLGTDVDFSERLIVVLLFGIALDDDNG